MITYKDQAGFRIIRVLPAEIGLHAVAHGLEHEPVRFPFHPGKTFGSQNRFLNGDLAHGLFEPLRLLRLVRAQDEGLPAGIMRVEMFVGAFTMGVCAQPAVRVSVELVLVGQRRVVFQRGSLHGAVVMIIVVAMIMALPDMMPVHGTSLVEVQPHAEPGVEFCMVRQFDEA